MKKFFTYFFVTLGVIFFVLILLALYLYIVNPNGIQTRLDPIVTEVLEEDLGLTEATFGGEGNTEVNSETSVESAEESETSVTPAQAEALEALGLDPAAISSITPEQEACFVRTLGQARVDEVKAGAVPNPIDLFKAKECI